MHPHRLPRFLVSAVTALTLLTATSTPGASEDLSWDFSEFRDRDTRRTTATLTYGIPETDAVQVRGVCEARSSTSVRTSSVIFGTDVGRLKNGADVELQFSGGGQTQRLKGTVDGVGNTEERVAGVRVALEHDSPVWTLLQRTPALDYLVPGYRSSTVVLGTGRREIQDFVETCKGYARVVESGSGEQDGSSSGSDAISEKEAFDIAKDLGTLDAWEAFLNNFPTGFRADLARAYVRRLGGNGTKTPSGGNQGGGTQNPPQTPGKTDVRPVFIDAGSTPWWNEQRRVAYDGGRRQYTASVESGGLELVTYCHRYGSNRDLTTIIREAYPRAGSNLGKALKSAARLAPRLRTPGAWDNARQIEVTFSDGSAVRQAATNGNNLQDQFYLLSRGRAIKARDPMVGRMMSERSMRVTAPNLDVTFQLRGSRKAICSVLNRCGARRSDCRGVSGSQLRKPIAGTDRCTGGRYFSRSRQACRCPSRLPVWNGVSCEAGQKSCGRNYRLVNGKCILRQNCGVNAYRNVEGDCFCKKGFELRGGKCRAKRRVKNCTKGRVFSTSRNKCVCPRNARHWYGGRCRPVRDCPGDSELINGICQKVNEDDGQDAPQNCGKGRTWVGGQGRCVCIDTRRRWNGKRCVLPRKSGGNQTITPGQVKQTACNVLKLVCASGNQKACQQVQKQGCQ